MSSANTTINNNYASSSPPANHGQENTGFATAVIISTPTSHDGDSVTYATAVTTPDSAVAIATEVPTPTLDAAFGIVVGTRVLDSPESSASAAASSSIPDIMTRLSILTPPRREVGMFPMDGHLPSPLAEALSTGSEHSTPDNSGARTSTRTSIGSSHGMRSFPWMAGFNAPAPITILGAGRHAPSAQGQQLATTSFPVTPNALYFAARRVPAAEAQGMDVSVAAPGTNATAGQETDAAATENNGAGAGAGAGARRRLF